MDGGGGVGLGGEETGSRGYLALRNAGFVEDPTLEAALDVGVSRAEVSLKVPTLAGVLAFVEAFTSQGDQRRFLHLGAVLVDTALDVFRVVGTAIVESET